VTRTNTRTANTHTTLDRIEAVVCDKDQHQNSKYPYHPRSDRGGAEHHRAEGSSAPPLPCCRSGGVAQAPATPLMALRCCQSRVEKPIGVSWQQMGSVLAGNQVVSRRRLSVHTIRVEVLRCTHKGTSDAPDRCSV
jgi:hypothetical protein